MKKNLWSFLFFYDSNIKYYHSMFSMYKRCIDEEAAEHRQDESSFLNKSVQRI
jgi:hypothetical protein